MGLHPFDTPIFKRVTESSCVTVSDEWERREYAYEAEGRALQLVDRPLVMVKSLGPNEKEKLVLATSQCLDCD